LQTTSPAFLARISPSSTSMPLSHATLPTLPTKIVSKIINHYFHTDTPSTPLHLCDIVLPHAASLRLVHSTFRAIIDDAHLLYRSVTLVTPKGWLRYFSPEEGVLVGSVEQRERASWVKEISLCFEKPDFPLKEGLTAEDVGAKPDSFESIDWFQSFLYPSLSADVRYIDIIPPYTVPSYYGTTGDLTAEAMLLETGGLDSDENHDGEDLAFSLFCVQGHVTEFYLQPFFVNPINHPIRYDTISLLSGRVPKLVEVLFADRQMMFAGVFAKDTGHPNNPCSFLQPAQLPNFYIYPSFLHSSHLKKPYSFSDDT
jgi:hypothetical protein